jgi:regulatory protein
MTGGASSQSEPLSLALKALDRKERTVAEMGSWLRARGVDDADSADVIDHLVSTGILDDTRYARQYVEDKRTLKRWGSGRIRTALIDRGISSDDVAEALASGPEEEIERAVELLAERGGTLADALERQKALGLLARRGYDSEVAYEAIRRVRHGDRE